MKTFSAKPSLAAGHRKVDLGAVGPTDPVALHALYAVGPVEVVERVQQLVGVPGDPEEPLLELAFDDDVARALAGPVREHLLVGEHRLAARAPVDRATRPGRRGPSAKKRRNITWFHRM